MNSYELYRNFFDWCFENPHKVTPSHVAIYCFSVEHCNRLGWKTNFGLPTTMVMEAVGIKSYNTYIKCFNDLVQFGFIKLVEKSKNQYSANIIALSKFNKALDKALDKAMIKHKGKQRESIAQSIDSINKPINNNTNIPIYQDTNIQEAQEALELFEIEFDKQEAFDLFWDLYQNKKGKDSAHKKFMKLSESEIRAILDHVPKYVQSTPDIEYRKHPTTYLNGKHWNDEITISNPQNKNQKPLTQIDYEKQHINSHVYKSLRGFEQSRSISAGTLKVARHYLSQTTTVIDVHEFARLLDQIENAGGIPDTVDFGTPLWLGLRESEQNDNSGHLRLSFDSTGEFDN